MASITTTDGSKTLYTYLQETVPGTPIAGAYKTLRSKVGVKFDLKRDTFMSKERRADRMESSMTYGNRSGSGSIPIEWSEDSYDAIMEAVLGGTWTGDVLKVGTVVRAFTFEETSNELNITEIHSGVQFTGFSISSKVNAIAEGSLDFIYRDTTAAQCKGVQIALTATTITRSTGKWSDDGFGANFTGSSRLLSVVMQGNANAAYNNVVCVVSAMTDTVLTTTGLGVVAAADGIVVNLASNRTSLVAADSTTPFDSFSGSITEGGNLIAHVTGWDLKVEQAMQPNFAMGAPMPQSISVGTLKVTGNLTVYYIDQALRKKFINGVPTSLSLVMSSGTKSFTFALGTVKYTSHTRDDNELARTESMAFAATYTAADTTIKITRVT